MDQTYTGVYGRIKALSLDLMSKEKLVALENVSEDDFLSFLSRENYSTEIDRFSSMYGMPDLLEVVVNTHFMRNVNNAITVLPPPAAETIRTYISKFDIRNIELILSSKVLGKDLETTEASIISNRGFPLVSMGGLLSAEDYINMANQKDAQEVMNYLGRTRYGSTIMKTRAAPQTLADVSGIRLALDKEYYTNLRQSFRFYNGDEGPLLGFLQGLIDMRNIMIIIKTAGTKWKIDDMLIDGGSISLQRLLELSSKGVEETAKSLPFQLQEALKQYQQDGLISGFEVELKKQLYEKTVPLFRQNSLSVGSVLGFIMLSEIERDTLRILWFRKHLRFPAYVPSYYYGI